MNRTDARTQFLTDILTTAVEGGINYWAEVNDYRPGVGTVIVDETGGDDVRIQRFRVTVDTIARGLSLIAKGDVRFMSNDLCARITAKSRLNDAGDLDAYDCDRIMQVALFGEVRYG